MMKSKEEEYWEHRYASGGMSGSGSTGASREWKWKVITEFLPSVDHVIDVGCGDLRFWDGRSCEDYTGIDISKTIIERNRVKRPEWKFIYAPAEKRIADLGKEVVFCFDLLFHIMNTKSYISILENLCFYSKKHIILNTWIKNNLGVTRIPYTDGRYQYFRPFENYMNIFEENDFKLVKRIDKPRKMGFIFLEKGSIYVFKKGDRI